MPNNNKIHSSLDNMKTNHKILIKTLIFPVFGMCGPIQRSINDPHL